MQGSAKPRPLSALPGVGLSQTMSHSVLLTGWCPSSHNGGGITFIYTCKVLISVFKGNWHGRGKPLPVREVESCAWGWLESNCIQTKTKHSLIVSFIIKY